VEVLADQILRFRASND